MRYIDAEPIENYEGWLDGTCLVIPKDLIYEAPTVEVEPVRYGHWTLETDEGKAICYHCSVCDSDSHYTGVKVASKYCPNCGAKMNEKV